jgi:hypothetical protein
VSSRRDDAIRNLKTLVFDDDEHRVSARASGRLHLE